MSFNNFFIALLCMAYTSLHGQNLISGKIYDKENQEPLVGASIQLLNDLNTGTITNSSGYFELITKELNPNLIISMIGYISREVKYEGKPLLLEMTGNPQELQTIVVTGSREAALRTQLPMAISRLSPKLIDESKITSVVEIINKTPGVLMQNLNNEQHGMSIRQPMGTSAYYLYMEDGLPIRPLGIFNHNALLEINQFAISSIEVVKGPVSSIYGPEAVGGAINFISQRPSTIPSAKVGVQFDNWGFRRVQFGTGATIGKFGFYIGGLSSKQTNSWITGSDYDKTSISSRLEYKISDQTKLVGTFVYGKYFSQMSGSIDSIAFFKREYISTSDFTYRKSDAFRSRISIEHEGKKGSKSFLTLFQRNNKHGQNPSYAIRWNPVPSATNNPKTARGEINSNNFESYGIVAQTSQKIKLLNSKLIIGALYDYSPQDYWSYLIELNAALRSDGKSVEKYTISKERPDVKIANYDAIILNSALYMQYDLKPTDKWNISLGARYDNMSFTYNNYINNSSGERAYRQFTPKLGMTYSVSENKGLYLNYSQGFAPPGLTAVFRPRPNTNPVEFYTNLEPATFQNYEIGGWASFLNNKVFIDIAVYQMNGKNELLNIRQQDNSFDYQSAGKTLHRGIEFGFTYKPSESIFLRYGGTNSLHQFEDFQVSTKTTDVLKNLGGFEMPSSPRWIWNTELSYYPSWAKNMRTSLEWQHLSGWFQNQINTVEAEGYDVFNFRIGYQFKGIEIYSNIMNLMDELYATGASRGNNLTDRTNYTPAAPRTIVLGIQYNFVKK